MIKAEKEWAKFKILLTCPNTGQELSLEQFDFDWYLEDMSKCSCGQCRPDRYAIGAYLRKCPHCGKEHEFILGESAA